MPMPQAPSPEEQELSQLQEAALRLEERSKELLAIPAHLEKIRREQEATLPPLDLVLERQKGASRAAVIISGDAQNTLITQKASKPLLFLLTLAAASLAWWAWSAA
jgi:hypothetical protein